MTQAELSPEARRVLDALKVLGTTRNFEERTARELIAAGLAEIRDHKLSVTPRGKKGVLVRKPFIRL